MEVIIKNIFHEKYKSLKPYKFFEEKIYFTVPFNPYIGF